MKRTFLIALLLSTIFYSNCSEENEGDKTPPSEVSDLTAAIADQQIILNWSDPADSDFDRTEITYSPGGSTPELVNAGVQTETIGSLTNGTQYTFTVKTIDTDNNKSTGVSVMATPAPPLQVLSPNPTTYQQWTDFGYNAGIISVTVEFSNSMDKNSVVIGETVILSTSSNQNVAGSITWNDDNTMTFTSNAVVTSWCSFTPDCFFTFTIVGENAGNGTVEDIFGQSLDENVAYTFGVLG